MTLIDRLPTELKFHIFYFATLGDNEYEESTLEYRPFEAIAMRNRDWTGTRTQRVLNVKLALVFVCKDWKKIATKLLYEHIRIGHGTDQLLDVLRPRGEAQNGGWVRHIEIMPIAEDYDPFNPAPIMHILACCSRVEVITRPYMVETGGHSLSPVKEPGDLFPTNNFPILPTVKRIDWWLPGIGFRGFLGQLVNHCPNLNYFTVGGGYGKSNPSRRLDDTYWTVEPKFGPREFPNIKTLRVEVDLEDRFLRETFIERQANHLLPNSTHLLLSILSAPIMPLLRIHGHLVQVLEFVDNNITQKIFEGVYRLPTITADVFNACPNLQELCVPLSMGAFLYSLDGQVVCNNLQAIRIKLDTDLDPLRASYFFWFIVSPQKAYLPKLKRVVFHGDRKRWEDNQCYRFMERYLDNVELEFA